MKSSNFRIWCLNWSNKIKEPDYNLENVELKWSIYFILLMKFKIILDQLILYLIRIYFWKNHWSIYTRTVKLRNANLRMLLTLTDYLWFWSIAVLIVFRSNIKGLLPYFEAKLTIIKIFWLIFIFQSLCAVFLNTHFLWF